MEEISDEIGYIVSMIVEEVDELSMIRANGGSSIGAGQTKTELHKYIVKLVKQIIWEATLQTKQDLRIEKQITAQRASL